MRIGERLAKIRIWHNACAEPYAGRGAGAIAHRRAAGEHQTDVIERALRVRSRQPAGGSASSVSSRSSSEARSSAGLRQRNRLSAGKS